MAHVWKNIPRGFQGFQNLISICTVECDNLRSLLPASVAKLLLQLQRISILGGNLMENVIQREDEAGDKRREDITMSFSSKAHAFEWPSIKQINLLSCPKLKTFYSEIESRRKQKKIDVPEPSVGSSAVRSRDTVGLFNRCLDSCVPGRSTKRSQGNNSRSLERNKHDINKEVTLTNQDEPNVSETENQTKMCSLFPYYLIESLGNLEDLHVDHCYSLEVIFELDEGLRDLEESNYIFNNLTQLQLQRLPKLLHIWKKGPRDIKGFNNLRFLYVRECNSLKCLFTPSMAKLLVKLEKIVVHLCNDMKEIIAKESGDEEKRDHVIAFPQVKTLSLVYLPKLECFCNQAISFEWPSLEKVIIVGCKELKMFVPTRSMKTPKLQGVHDTWSQTFQPMIEGDLNTTIQHIIKGKVRYSAGFPNFLANLQEILNLSIYRGILSFYFQNFRRIYRRIYRISEISSSP
ncbi:hypothetical protein I3843_16G011200 [Carya illinoinensis]|nr:hypothetical protein I3843_16G011200 [Carya illinoinensis]